MSAVGSEVLDVLEFVEFLDESLSPGTIGADWRRSRRANALVGTGGSAGMMPSCGTSPSSACVRRGDDTEASVDEDRDELVLNAGVD